MRFGAFITRRLVRRLQPMIEATGAWARGDFEAVARVSGEDELAALAEHLNKMAGELSTLVALRQELAASEERNRLARDLHDTVKQRLFATTMQLGAARTLLPRHPEKAEAHLVQASELVGGSQRDLMAILRQLRPSAQRESWTERLSREVEAWSTRTGIQAETRLSEFLARFGGAEGRSAPGDLQRPSNRELRPCLPRSPSSSLMTTLSSGRACAHCSALRRTSRWWARRALANRPSS
jgi:signal transduction histidine kinase